MKIVFIVNPCAGQGNRIKNLIDKVNNLTDVDKEVYITKSVGDATQYVKEYCRNNGAARFIACGGDGTLSEVLNGVIGFEDAEVGVIPIGTGNDFCRNFECDCSFENVLNQISGKSVKCDAIRYTSNTPKGSVTGYCANMFNIGFDCNVADLTAKMKKRPFISGSLAYLLSIFVTLIGKKGANLKIEIDGRQVHNGKLLLTSVANGCFCGGGIKSNPLASICDGLININIIRNIARTRFLCLLPHYMKGSHINMKNIEKIITNEKCSKIKITPIGGNMRICVDGEIIDAGESVFEICPSVFKFVIPRLPDRNNIRETVKIK